VGIIQKNAFLKIFSRNLAYEDKSLGRPGENIFWSKKIPPTNP
jgi:hypothetical protein